MTDQKPAQNPLFREGAMEKLGSPEELDRLMHVTNPKGWLALIALAVLVLAATIWGVFGTIPIETNGGQGILLHRNALHEVVSQVPGQVTEVRVKQGDNVKKGQIVARVRIDTGAKIDVVSLFSGKVDEIAADKGMTVNRGQQIAVLEKGNEPLQAVAFVPVDVGKQLKKGTQVHVSPSTVKSDAFGYMQGRVSSVSQFPITRSGMRQLLLNDSLVDTLYTSANQLEVRVDLVRDSSTKSGFEWSSSKGPPFTISHGTLCTTTFVLGEERPVNLVLPSQSTVQ